MHARAVPICLGFPRPFVPETSPKGVVTSQRIEREGLGKSRTGTRQGLALHDILSRGDTGKCPLSVLTGVRIKWVIFSENVRASHRNKRNYP